MYNTPKILDWDSQFFGYKVAVIKTLNLNIDELDKIIKKIREENIRLAYCFASPDDEISNFSLRSSSGLLVDEKITFFIRTTDTELFTDTGLVASYDLNYTTEKLKSLALQSGQYSRFRIDPNFKNSEYEKLYSEWIEKSVQRIIAKEVLVYKENGELKGLITLGLEGNTGSIGLLAVDEKERGKSIGKKLVQSALIYFKEKKVSIVEVVTQVNNEAACRFYKSLGFMLKNIVNIYHLWIS